MTGYLPAGVENKLICVVELEKDEDSEGHNSSNELSGRFDCYKCLMYAKIKYYCVRS